MNMESKALDEVMAAQHPSPQEGGPCATCAFRPGTEANQTEHTTALVRLCVEGMRLFHCHEKKQLCRGYLAAANLRGVPAPEESDKVKIAGFLADQFSSAISRARDSSDAKQSEGPERSEVADSPTVLTGAPKQ